MPPLAEQIEVQIANDLPERIGVFGFLHPAIGPFDPQPIRRVLIDPPDKEAAALLLQPGELATILARQHRDGSGTGLIGPYHPPIAVAMLPEQREGIVVARVAQRRNGAYHVTAHTVSPPSSRSAARASPSTGTPIQSGRFAAS